MPDTPENLVEIAMDNHYGYLTDIREEYFVYFFHRVICVFGKTTLPN